MDEDIHEAIGGKVDEDVLDDLRNNIVDDPQTEDEILDEVKNLLGQPYSRAKQTHIWAEEERGEHNWVAMTNFRDALDHMSKIFQNLEENNIQKARENLGEMEAHIQRAAFDSAQSVPEKKLGDLFDKRMESILYRITLSDAPSEEEYQDRLEKNQRTDNQRERKESPFYGR